MPRKKMTKEEKKSRITLNINENLLDKIDEIINEINDKRSRFIERLLTDYIKSKETPK